MSADYATNSEHDAGISAAFDAYPEPPAIETYELAAEENPYQWPSEATGRLMEALRAAIEEAREARRAEQ